MYTDRLPTLNSPFTCAADGDAIYFYAPMQSHADMKRQTTGGVDIEGVAVAAMDRLEILIIHRQARVMAFDLRKHVGLSSEELHIGRPLPHHATNIINKCVEVG